MRVVLHGLWTVWKVGVFYNAQTIGSASHTLPRRLTSRRNVGQLVLSGKHPRWQGVMKLDGTKARSYCTVIPCRNVISTQG
jgi:hypothetical protein